MMVEEKDPLGNLVEELPDGQLLGESRDQIAGPEHNLEEGKKFLFGGDVAATFEDDVISRQIPGYREMRYLINSITVEFVRPGHSVVDLGTSQGRVLTDLARSLVHDPLRIEAFRGYTGQVAQLIGIESEPDMVIQAKNNMERISAELGLDSTDITLEVVNHDLRTGIGPLKVTPTLFTSVFTLQFVPMEHRPRLLREMYNRLEPGGALLLAEKVLHPGVEMDDLLTRLYYASKARNGLDRQAIVRKRASLEGFLVPLTHEGNVQLLQAAGFQPGNIATVWRNLQFEAVLAVK